MLMTPTHKTTILALLIFLMIVLGSASVLAPPPATQTTGDVSPLCEIESPGPYNWVRTEEREVHFHVINSTGAPMAPSEIQCVVHFYNNSGAQTYENNSVTDFDAYDWEVVIPAHNLSTKDHSLLIQCNTTGFGCYSVYPVYVSPSGNEEHNNGATLPVTLVYLLLTVLVVLTMVLSKRAWLKVLMLIPLNLLITAMFRFTTIFVELQSPAETSLINLLNKFYLFSVGITYPLAGVCVVIVIIMIGKSLVEMKKKKATDGWAGWGDL